MAVLKLHIRTASCAPNLCLLSNHAPGLIALRCPPLRSVAPEQRSRASMTVILRLGCLLYSVLVRPDAVKPEPNYGNVHSLF